MPRDKGWVLLDDRRLEPYKKGCLEFLKYAFDNAAIEGKIRCPCQDCKNKKFGDYDLVHRYLLWRGMCKLYSQGMWTWHKEREDHYHEDVLSDSNGNEDDGLGVDAGIDMDNLLRACLYPTQEDPSGAPIAESDDFRRLIEKSQLPPCTQDKDYSKLYFIIELYQIKSRGKMSDKTFSETLQILKKAFPHINIPESFYETKKLIEKLCCGYKKIDACENDCMLFWKDDKELDVSTQGRKKVPRKVLRHFLLIPRIQRLYLSKNSAIDMRWHAKMRCKDGTLRHPTDSDAWKEFDKKHESFSLESHNVRLGLASDGFNPFGGLSSTYSTWPVILMVYNLPPEICMQRSQMITSLLISGKKGPKNNIDVYLQPLIKELQELWGT